MMSLNNRSYNSIMITCKHCDINKYTEKEQISNPNKPIYLRMEMGLICQRDMTTPNKEQITMEGH